MRSISLILAGVAALVLSMSASALDKLSEGSSSNCPSGTSGQQCMGPMGMASNLPMGRMMGMFQGGGLPFQSSTASATKPAPAARPAPQAQVQQNRFQPYRQDTSSTPATFKPFNFQPLFKPVQTAEASRTRKPASTVASRGGNCALPMAGFMPFGLGSSCASR